MNERIFMTFSAKVAHETGNNLKYFRNIAGNSLNTGLLFLFSGFVILVMLWKNGQTDFHDFFYEISDTTQEIIS